MKKICTGAWYRLGEASDVPLRSAPVWGSSITVRGHRPCNLLLGGPATAMGAVCDPLGVGPVLDRALWLEAARLKCKPTSGTPFRGAPTTSHAFLHVCAIATIWSGWRCSAQGVVLVGGPPPWCIHQHLLGSSVASSSRTNSGSHRDRKSISARLARMNMLLVLYGHFTECSHNVTHHKHVATRHGRSEPPQMRERRSGVRVARTVQSSSGTPMHPSISSVGPEASEKPCRSRGGL